ncbi:MAG: hypothetical protein HYZ36_05840, partial [Pedosphaera parvula]|nr:hypothetical protein [Pedosphaera parvula]
DTARGKLDQVVLTETWRRYSIDLRAKDLSRIKTGFAFVINGQERPVVFYLDDIQYAE